MELADKVCKNFEDYAQVKFLSIGPIFLFIFDLFIIQKLSTKKRRLVWDSNPGPQEGRRTDGPKQDFL